MILFRPYAMGISLDEAMQEKRVFKSLKDMMQTLVDEHNSWVPYFQIKIDELYIGYYSDSDERCGWHDLFYVCFRSYDDIANKEGYKKFFGGEIYHHPVGLLGFWTTDWDLDYPKLKSFTYKNTEVDAINGHYEIPYEGDTVIAKTKKEAIDFIDDISQLGGL